MRTTLTLDDATYHAVETLARERRLPLKEAFAEVLRLGLDAVHRIEATEYRPTITPHHGGPTVPHLNYDKISELLDYSEGEDRRW